ncbi:hypothetical protein GOBAR_AA18296 [Gossypium barbadense]|uniref:Uncharacterized protein n=1 Tax=Gossypium barbadense TaxID=3634 RepID=A0A2P5XG86_GOSBA|nr:hypothetical protein GOBAR_AA18296 [Gossypium barbadense]
METTFLSLPPVVVVKHRLVLVAFLDGTVGADEWFVMFSAVFEIVEANEVVAMETTFLSLPPVVVVKHRLVLVAFLDGTVGADEWFVMFSAVFEIVEGETFRVPVKS